MLVILFYFLIYELQITSQFPNHIDLEKLGEIKYDNEIYNFFKPSVHIVKTTEDNSLRRGNNLPKKIFIDTNGLIHYWKSFKPNFRKFDVIFENRDEVDEETNDTIDKTVEKEKDETINELVEDGRIKETEVDAKSKENGDENDINDDINTTEDPMNLTADNEKDEAINRTEEDGTIKETKVNAKSSENQDKSFNDDITTTESPNEDVTIPVTRSRRPKRKRHVLEHIKDTVYIPRPRYLRNGTGRTVVKTTFFCPFLGIFTMKSLID